MIGKSWGPVALVVNPTLERSFAGQPNPPVEFEPRGKVGYAFGDESSLSLAYFSALGPTSGFDLRSEQKHQLFAELEKEIGTGWDAAISLGRGLTTSSDRYVVATRVEYRLSR
jgi:hypothetical protein